jgi:hypothetical protein
MNPIKFQRLLKVSFCSLGVLLLSISWWHIQQSHCVADLKSGLGDIESGLSFENTAVAFHLSSILFFFLALFIHIQNQFKLWWVRAVFLAVLLPVIASMSFLAVSFSGHASWVCHAT